MRFARWFVLGCLCLLGFFGSAGATPGDDIRRILDGQAAAWNRADLKQFVASYAEHCTLIGAAIDETTREGVLAHYRRKYPTPGAMGKLMFSGIAVHSVDAHVATATGHWHLDRNAISGGSVGGVFSLVVELLDGHWQIVLDHTS